MTRPLRPFNLPERDPFDPARGVVLALAISTVFWAVAAVGVWLWFGR